MALIPNQTPEQQQAVAAFKAKYPNIPPGGRYLQAWLAGHPEAYPDIKALSEILEIPEGRHLNPGTMSSERSIGKVETILTAAAIVGGGYVAGTAIAGAAGAGAAGGGAAAGTGAGAAGAGTAGAIEGGGTLAANLGGAGALGAGGGAAGAGAGAAAAGTAAGTTAATVPTLEGGTTVAANLGGASALPAGSAAAGAAPAGASPSIWSRIFGNSTADKVLTGVGMGSNLVGNIIQSRQASKAAEAQEKAAAEALALQSNIYQQQRADLAPYRNAGASSLASLSYGLGLNPSAQADTTTPYFQQQAQQQNAAVPGQAQPRNPASLASLSGPVQLRAPNGQVKAVDPSQVQHYISMGATPV